MTPNDHLASLLSVHKPLLRRMQPEESPAECVEYTLQRISDAEKEAAWFDANGPKEWRLRLMTIRHGKISSRVNFMYNRDYPLALGFEGDERFSGGSDSDRWIRVAEHFKFENPAENRDLQNIAFLEREWHVGNLIITPEDDYKFLNVVWGHVLGEHWRVGQVGYFKSPSWLK